MKRWDAVLAVVPLMIACVDQPPPVSATGLAAESFLNGVYACDQAALDTLAAEDVVVSYPVFKSIFGKSAIRGRSDVIAFADRFCSRWSDPVITIHEVVQDGQRVVLVWNFAATSSVLDSMEVASPPGRQSWGGISFFRFDSDGRVVEELGEESTPGPIARLRENP